ncbi:MAG: tetratricopeptide repeat protein [Bryobacteraceae bacterium]|nr:tetratricopeptide repeat protein [Bryobacteraceae bacterium]
MNRLLGHLGFTPAKKAGAKARAAIRKVFELDDSLGEAYALSGAYRAWLDFDWRRAEDDFNRAAALSPAAVETHWLRTLVLLPHNRMEEAVQEMERAIELDPLSPLLHSLFAWLLGFKRDSRRALAESETALALGPEHPIALGLRGSVLYFSGRLEEGVALWQSAVSKMAGAPTMLAALGYGLGRLGRNSEARAILAGLDAAEKKSYVTPFSRGLIYVGLGEIDAAFEWLDRAIDERDVNILHFAVKPVYDPIRADPRFHALLRKINLEP